MPIVRINDPKFGPNGTTVTFPEGMTPEEMSEAIKKNFYPEPEAPAEPPTRKGLIGNYGEGISLGGDQMAHKLGTVQEIAGRTFGLKGMENRGRFLRQGAAISMDESMAGMDEDLKKSSYQIYQEEGFGSAVKAFLDGRRLARNLGQMTPAALEMLVPAGAVGQAAKGVAKVAGLGAKGTKLAGSLASGAVVGIGAGVGEGANTYEEALELYGGDEEKATKAFVQMAVVSGFLNALPAERIFRGADKTIKAQMWKALGTSVLEGATELAEEPLEATILGQDPIKATLQGLDVLPSAMLLGGGTAGVHDLVTNRFAEKAKSEAAARIQRITEQSAQMVKDLNLARAPKAREATAEAQKEETDFDIEDVAPPGGWTTKEKVDGEPMSAAQGFRDLLAEAEGRKPTAEEETYEAEYAEAKERFEKDKASIFTPETTADIATEEKHGPDSLKGIYSEIPFTPQEVEDLLQNMNMENEQEAAAALSLYTIFFVRAAQEAGLSPLAFKKKFYGGVVKGNAQGGMEGELLYQDGTKADKATMMQRQGFFSRMQTAVEGWDFKGKPIDERTFMKAVLSRNVLKEEITDTGILEIFEGGKKYSQEEIIEAVKERLTPVRFTIQERPFARVDRGSNPSRGQFGYTYTTPFADKPGATYFEVMMHSEELEPYDADDTGHFQSDAIVGDNFVETAKAPTTPSPSQTYEIFVDAFFDTNDHIVSVASRSPNSDAVMQGLRDTYIAAERQAALFDLQSRGIISDEDFDDLHNRLDSLKELELDAVQAEIDIYFNGDFDRYIYTQKEALYKGIADLQITSPELLSQYPEIKELPLTVTHRRRLELLREIQERVESALIDEPIHSQMAFENIVGAVKFLRLGSILNQNPRLPKPPKDQKPATKGTVIGWNRITVSPIEGFGKVGLLEEAQANRNQALQKQKNTIAKERAKVDEIKAQIAEDEAMLERLKKQTEELWSIYDKGKQALYDLNPSGRQLQAVHHILDVFPIENEREAAEALSSLTDTSLVPLVAELDSLKSKINASERAKDTVRELLVNGYRKLRDVESSTGSYGTGHKTFMVDTWERPLLKLALQEAVKRGATSFFIPGPSTFRLRGMPKHGPEGRYGNRMPSLLNKILTEMGVNKKMRATSLPTRLRQPYDQMNQQERDEVRENAQAAVSTILEDVWVAQGLVTAGDMSWMDAVNDVHDRFVGATPHPRIQAQRTEWMQNRKLGGIPYAQVVEEALQNLREATGELGVSTPMAGMIVEFSPEDIQKILAPVALYQGKDKPRGALETLKNGKYLFRALFPSGSLRILVICSICARVATRIATDSAGVSPCPSSAFCIASFASMTEASASMASQP